MACSWWRKHQAEAVDPKKLVARLIAGGEDESWSRVGNITLLLWPMALALREWRSQLGSKRLGIYYRLI